MAEAVTVQDITDWDADLRALTEGLGRLFNRPEPKVTFGLMVRALLADVPEKNSWGLAEHAGLATPRPFEHLLDGAVRDADLLRDHVRDYVVAGLGSADAGYGRDPGLRAYCHDNTIPCVIAAPVDLPLVDARGKALCSNDILTGRSSQWERRPVPASHDIEYFLVHATMAAMARTAGLRWNVEDDNKTGKDQLGMDQCQVRKWTPWYRHVTMCVLAQAFLAVTRAGRGKEAACQSSEAVS
jgi:hypothetical protein